MILWTSYSAWVSWCQLLLWKQKQKHTLTLSVLEQWFSSQSDLGSLHWFWSQPPRAVSPAELGWVDRQLVQDSSPSSLLDYLVSTLLTILSSSWLRTGSRMVREHKEFGGLRLGAHSLLPHPMDQRTSPGQPRFRGRRMDSISWEKEMQCHNSKGYRCREGNN